MGIRLVIAPGALARAYAFMAREFFGVLVRDGGSARYADRMLTFDAINRLLGLPELSATGNAYDMSDKKAAE